MANRRMTMRKIRVGSESTTGAFGLLDDGVMQQSIHGVFRDAERRLDTHLLFDPLEE